MSTLQDKCLNTLRSGTPLWSQDQAIAYEAALDCIRDVVGEYLNALAEEEQKEDRNFENIDAFKKTIEICWHWRDNLQVTDDANVAYVRSSFV